MIYLGINIKRENMHRYSERPKIYNKEVRTFMDNLKELRPILENPNDSFKNKELIEIASAVKRILSNLKEKHQHALDAFGFIEKCMAVREYKRFKYDFILTALYEPIRVFEAFNEKIDSGNLYDLLTSNRAKIRCVIFDVPEMRTEFNHLEIKQLLDKYQEVLETLEYIDANRISLMKRQIGYEYFFDDLNISFTMTKNDIQSGFCMLQFNEKEKTFTGESYTPLEERLASSTQYAFHINDKIFYSFDSAKEEPKLLRWIEVFMPEYLI